MSSPRLVNVKHNDYWGGQKLGEELCRATINIPTQQTAVCIVQV